MRRLNKVYLFTLRSVLRLSVLVLALLSSVMRVGINLARKTSLNSTKSKMASKFKQSRLVDSRGDTLVEVLLSTVVLSIVLAGAFSLSSRALRLNQTATERTEAVNKMREQTELIRYINQNYQNPSDPNQASLSLVWDEIVKHANGAAATPFYLDFLDSAGGIKDISAINNPSDASDYVPDFEMIPGPRTDSYGVNGVVDIFDIWVVPEIDGSLPAEYIDFVVQAEWEGIGEGDNKQTGASVLRLPL